MVYSASAQTPEPAPNETNERTNERETAALYLSLSHTGPFHHSAAGFGGQNEKKRLH